MEKNAGQLVQAVPLIEGKTNVGAGTIIVNSLLHCETDGSITFGATGTYNFVAGMDRTISGEVVIVSGTFTYD